MKLTKFGKRTFALIALAIIAIALVIGAVILLGNNAWRLCLGQKAYNVLYMAVCLPVGIASILKLTDHI